MARQRLRMAGVSAEMDDDTRIRRQVEEYFSMVRRRACWASSDRDSASFITITGGDGRGDGKGDVRGDVRGDGRGGNWGNERGDRRGNVRGVERGDRCREG